MARSMISICFFMLASALVRADQQLCGGECPSDDEHKDTVSLVQTNLQLSKHGDKDSTGATGGGFAKTGGGGTANGTHIASASQPPEGRIKLIVNSDVRYSAPLGTLFESMEKASFYRWNDVIVMRGSASQDSDPYTPDTPYGKRGVTYIDLKLSSFDLHGFSGLYHHLHDSRVEADVYFYIHDTVLVNSTFPNKFDSMASTGKFEVRHPPPPSNNQCVFGSGVVDNYGTHFDTPMTKSEGLAVELEGSVTSFAEKETLLERTHIDYSYTQDLWHTGFPRRPVFSPSFGLTKYVLWGLHGDLTGHFKLTLAQIASLGDNRLCAYMPCP